LYGEVRRAWYKALLRKNEKNYALKKEKWIVKNEI
jgi:hypothetical protein